jgi:ATP-dependent exoDNAse (exonuclease V) beta subunit
VAVENNRMVCEWDWLRVGSPYFKVYPALVPLLSNVGIDVPVDYLRLPFQAFAIHALLEAAMRDPGADLRDLAYASLQHEGLDPARADEAIAVVRSVTASQVWKRAQESDRRLMEVPFQTLMSVGSPEAGSVPTVLRGVIDLAFHEPKGWVIVDYKTDVRPVSHVPALVDHYRGQVETYAKAWREMTGESVAEKGLYFTYAGAYARV